MASDKDLAKLTVQLELQAAAFEAGAKEMDRTLKRMEKNTSRSSKGFNNLNKALKKVGISFGALAGALSVRALANATQEAIAFGDAIAKTSQKVGVSVEELQELRFAAKQSGVDVRQLDMGIQRFARRMGEAAQGTGELLKTTQALGIEFKNADGTNKSTVQLLEQYAEAIGRAETQQEKLRLAFKAFDSEGAALVNLIGDGGKNMEELREQARKLGLVMSADVTKVAEELNDQLNILSSSLKNELYESLILASYGFARLFGFRGTLDAEIAYYQAKISELDEELKEFIDEGNVILARDRASKIAKIAEESLNPLLEKARELNEATATDDAPEITGPSDEVLKKYQKLVDIVKESEDPLYKYKQQAELIKEAWLASALTIEQAGKLLADLAKEAYENTDPEGIFNKKVDEFIAGLNAEANATAEQLGIMYAALERISDPALRAEIEALIEALELGGEDFKPEEKLEGLEAALAEIKGAVDGFARDFTDELFSALESGEARFDEFAKNILKTIAKIILNKIFEQFFTAITNPIFSSLGLSTAGIDLGDEGLNASIAQSNQALTREGEASTQMMTVGRVQPQLKSASQSPVTVNVNNYGKDEVQVAERRDSNGGIEIDVLIKSTVRQGFANGDFDKVMQNTYGARRLGY